MAQFPALPLWTDAYLADTTHLSATEHGAYLLLLMSMWRTPDTRLPNDDDKLSRLARVTRGQWNKMKPTIMAFFKIDGEWIYQGRLTDEAQAVRQKSKRQSDKVKARWLKTKETDNTTVLPDENQTDTSLNPYPNPVSSVVSARDPACDFIEIFDTVRQEAFGSSLARPWPHSQDISIARRWRAVGADLALVERVYRSVMVSLAKRGRSPPDSLAYFDKPIANAIAAAKQPMPEGKIDEAHRGNRQPTKTDRLKESLARAAIAGGFAPSQYPSEAGTDDDSLPMLPVA